MSAPAVAAAATPAVRTEPKAILTPTADLVVVGGLSVVLLLAMLLVRHPALEALAEPRTGLAFALVVSTLINSPHFVSSWILLYASKETRERHRWAAYWIPVGLAVYCALAFWVGNRTSTPTYLLLAVASLYLAWHYTGQTWGMMATFAHLEGVPATDRERTLVRTSLRILLAFHVSWALHHAIDLPPRYEVLTLAAYRTMRVVTLAAIGLGLVGLALWRKRIARPLPLRVAVPWLATCLWYTFLAQFPKGGIFWVQNSHALQYLIFPLRVESNRYAAQAQRRPPRVSHRAHMALYVLGVLLLGWTVFEAIPALGALFSDRVLNPGAERPYPPGLLGVLVTSAVNVHHYFTDGVVWKLRNPAVRRELFAHLPRAA